MIKVAFKLYPEAFLAAQAIHSCCPLPFPLNVSHLLDGITNYRIYDLSSQTYNRSCAQNQRQMLHPKKAWTIYGSGLDTYLILWNKAQSQASIRFSVAHELGHILLNHQRGWPTDRPLTKQKKENEANTFARSLLAPFHAIQQLCNGGPFNARQVAAHFGIPYHAAAQLRYDYAYWSLATP